MRRILLLFQWLAQSEPEKVSRTAGESRNPRFRQAFQGLGWHHFDPSGESGIRLVRIETGAAQPSFGGLLIWGIFEVVNDNQFTNIRVENNLLDSRRSGFFSGSVVYE